MELTHDEYNVAILIKTTCDQYLEDFLLKIIFNCHTYIVGLVYTNIYFFVHM